MERRRSDSEVAMEVKSLRRIISAYINYADAAEMDVKSCERSFKKLSPAHKAVLSHFPSKFQRFRRCIAANSHFILNMLQAFEPPLDMSYDVDVCEQKTIENMPNDQYLLETSGICEERSFCCGRLATTSGRSCSSEQFIHGQGNDGNEPPVKKAINQESSSLPRLLDPSLQLNVPPVDVDKVRCIIRNIVRDWASEGRRERDQCYKPILEELNRLFPSRFPNDRAPSCLVPGAGLGRLALEISCLGFVTQGNEFSYYMMICSSFILNCCQTASEWTIFPWIHSNCNSLSDNDQFRPVSFPDIHPASAGITEGFSMCCGDFVEVYSDASQEGAWDAVVTCFFLDTAHNIVEYIEIISKILKENGVWINLGPLLYHFADAYGTEDEMSIELSLEDVKKVAFHYGFELEFEKTIETTYTANPRSMMQNWYFAAFWTMKKKYKSC